MTEESAANREDHPAARRASDRAIANSSPDFNHMMMRLVRNLLSTQQSGPVVQTASMFFGLLLAMLMLFFVVGLPALNGTTILIDKLSESRSAERSYQLDMFKLQTDLEIKKLDRTMLGDGAMKTLLDISKKMDEQAVAQVQIGQAVKEQGEIVTRLSSEVGALRAGQVAGERRLSALAAQQERQGEALRRQPLPK